MNVANQYTDIFTELDRLDKLRNFLGTMYIGTQVFIERAVNTYARIELMDPGDDRDDAFAALHQIWWGE